MTREEIAAMELAGKAELSMDETAFRLFYERTARGLRAYLWRLTGEWLAYVERFSHREIARVVGAKEQSIRPMLSRARDRFAALLKGEKYESA